MEATTEAATVTARAPFTYLSQPRADELDHKSKFVRVAESEEHSSGDCGAAADSGAGECNRHSKGKSLPLKETDMSIRVATLEAELNTLRVNAVSALDKLWAHCHSSAQDLSSPAPPEATLPNNSQDDAEVVASERLQRWLAYAQRLPCSDEGGSMESGASSSAAMPRFGHMPDQKIRGAEGRRARIEASSGGADHKNAATRQPAATSLQALREMSRVEMGRKMADMNVRLAKTRDLEQDNVRLKREVSFLESRLLEEPHCAGDAAAIRAGTEVSVSKARGRQRRIWRHEGRPWLYRIFFNNADNSDTTGRKQVF
jgi:hypothetical protein